MGLFTLFSLIFLAAPAAAEADPAWRLPWTSLSELESLLSTVPEGRSVLRAAELKDPAFAAKIKLGTASYTESTFTRTYSLVDGKEQIGLRHEITLNRRLSLSDAVVDLAHELVHFSEKGMLDPYRPGFALEQFIRNGIEGEGGELAALGVECRVAWSLETRYANFPVHTLCEKYRGSGNVFRRSAAKADYYAIGTWWDRSGGDLRESISELSDSKVVFTSSYAGKPYPLALAEEFAMTRKAACVNNRRKYRLIASQSTTTSNQPSVELLRERVRLKAYDRLYCRDGVVEEVD